MLERTHSALHREGDRCAVATGADTVLVWRLPSDPESPPTTEPESKIETGRSPLRGVAFISKNFLLTVHQLGECVIWKLPERRELPTADPEAAGTSDGEEGLTAPSETSSDGDTDGESETALATTEEGAPLEDDESKPDDIPTAGEKWSKELGVEIASFRARARGGAVADRIAIGGRDGELVVAAVERSSSAPLEFGLVDAHDNDVTCLSFAPRSERIATGGRDHRIAIWSTDPADFEPRDGETSDDSSPPTDAGGSDGAGGSSTEESDPKAKVDKTLDAPVIPRRLVLEGSEG